MKKHQLWKRGIGLLAALALLVGLLPLGALAAPDTAAGTSPGSIVGKAYSDNPNAYEIYPVPHSVDYLGDSEDAFEMTDAVNVVLVGDVDEYTTDFLEEILERFDRTMTISNETVDNKTNIVLAVHGASDPVEPEEYEDLFTSADKFDPYILTADAAGNGTITIVGKNADCVYYGVATLQMMFTSFNGETFLPVRIEDYSETVFRGFIEGFYGGFDYVERESQIRSLRDFKGNMYVFASKTDPYHGSHCLEPYPTGEGSELPKIEKLVQAGKESKVEYTWSMHIGKGRALGDAGVAITDEVYADRLAKAKAKFQQLYDIGVRSFQILNDDYNSGTYARQVEFLNEINRWLHAPTTDPKGGIGGDCMPLIYCCGGYNNDWAGDGSEATALAGLADDIYLYWTGTDVNSPINDTGVNYLYNRSNHNVVTWLNYPCSEHAKSGLFLGDLTHYVGNSFGTGDSFGNALAHQKGLISNPIDASEPNKVAFFQLFSWAWNRKGNATTRAEYDRYLQDMWESSFKYLQPEVYESYLTLGRNIANCPNSGRVSNGFPESEYIKEKLESVQAAIMAGQDVSANANAVALLRELDNIQAAIADFRDHCDNTALITQMEPFLKSLESVVTAAAEGINAAKALSAQDISGAWNSFAAGSLALGQWDKNHPVNEGNGYAAAWAKSGSKRLQPFADAVLNYVREAMGEVFDPGGGFGEPTFYAKLHGVVRGDDAQSAKMFDGNVGTFASYESGMQEVDDYYGVDLGKVELVTAVDILQGKTDTDQDYFHNATLEYSLDGESWVTLAQKVNSHHIRVDGLEIAARYVRLRLLVKGFGGKNDYWTHVREFAITTREADSLYTNAAATPNAAIGEDGSSYVLTVTAATLAKDEYVGIRLPEITGVNDIATTGTLPAGVRVEYSVSGVNWTAGSPSTNTAVGYVRLVNTGSGSASLANVTLAVSHPAQLNLQYVTNEGMPLYSGAWGNMVDGNRATQVHIGVKQAYGQYVIFDLGGVIPVHDVSMYFPEKDTDVPHNLDVFLGDSLTGTWKEIYSPSGGQLRGDLSYDMDMPYRKFVWTGNGKNARYIKLAIADVEAQNWYYMNELEINTTVTEETPLGAVTASSGTAENGGDGNLLTFYTPADSGAGWWQKLLQEPVEATKVTILRGEGGGNAVAYVQQENGSWEELGTLAQSATAFELTGKVTGVKVEWTAGNAPSIAEVVITEEHGLSGTAEAARPSIYEKPADPTETFEVPNGTAAVNVPLPQTVNANTGVNTGAGKTVAVPVEWTCGSDNANYDANVAGNYTFTGTLNAAAVGLANPGCFTLTATVTVRPAQGGTGAAENLVAARKAAWASGKETSGNSPDKAVDDDSSANSRWNSNYMKVTATHPSWIVVDLGENVTGISAVTVRYHNMVWPTNYKIQVADSSFTPHDYSTENGAGSGTLNANTFAGDNEEDAECWKTLKTYTNQSYSNGPMVETDDLTALPQGFTPRYLRLYFTGINPNAVGHCVSVWNIEVTGTRSAAAVNQNITSIAPCATVQAQTGTAAGDLVLPNQVIATLADGTKVGVPVAWTCGSYDANVAGNYTFTGALGTLPTGVTNTSSVAVPSLTVTLTAPITYTVTFQGVNVTTATVTVNENAAVGSRMPADPTREGYTFGGWTVGNVVFTGETPVTGNTTVTAKWTPVTYAIHYDLDGGAAVGNPTTYTVESGAITLTAPTKAGHAFAGWTWTGLTEPTMTVTIPTGSVGDREYTATWVKGLDIIDHQASGFTGTYDGQDHGITVTVTTPATDAAVTYCATADGTYTADSITYTDVGEYTVYYKVTADGYEEASGNATVTITKAAPALTLGASPASLTTAGTVTLTVTAPDYVETDGITVTCDDEEIALTRNADGTYTVELPEALKTYTFTATLAETANYAAATAQRTVAVRKPSSGSSSSGSSTTTTTTNDGDKVTTVTKPDGTVTETTEKADGTVAVVETKKDGTVTETTEKVDGTVAVVETKTDGTVTETVTNPEGSVSEKVTDPDENVTITVTDPEGEVLVEVSIPAEIPKPEVTFVDVVQTPWAEKAINNVAALNLVNGVGGNKYDPATPMTRGSLATVLHRLSQGKSDYEVAFKDVSENKFYTEGVAWAAKAKVVNGYTSDIFAPDDIITREQLAVMMARYAKLIGMDTTAKAESLNTFVDGESTGAWAVDGMAWCVENGILQGKGLNNLDPTANVSRAEVAVMLDRFIALIQK